MNTHRLQAAFARRREAEHLRIEKTSEVNRYFDHWSKVTSRFESWTTPEYYRQAQETLEKRQEKIAKDKMLEERRNKLRVLLNEENANYEEELRLSRRPKSKKVSTDVLRKIDDNLRSQEEGKRRLELESRLYGRWRYGLEGPNERDLFNSKSDNETMAKLNWLDKQIEKNMQKEKEEKESEERKLRMQTEVRKHEEQLMERQKIRESEIKELRALQENHLTELKLREAESEELHEQEVDLKNKIEVLANELNKFKMRKGEGYLKAPTVYNTKRIKMHIRQRSDTIRQDLKDDIDLLSRVNEVVQNQQIENLIDNFKYQYHTEVENQTQIEAMYESEVKYNLKKWEDTWRQQAETRKDQILRLLGRQQSMMASKLSENVDKQKLLVEVRETHLAAIENSNEKLKMLSKEGDSYDVPYCSPVPEIDICKTPSVADSVTEKLSHCTLETSVPTLPKFGRKRVAWT